MINFILGYAALLDLMILAAGFAFSQYIVLRSGTFSVATAGLVSIGAYTSGILTVKYGVHPAISVVASTFVGTFVAVLLSVPLARLKGVYQAIASLAFVQIVEAFVLYFEDYTGGALGLNGVPRVANTWILLLALAVVVYVLWALNRSGIGRAYEAMRQDEAVATSLGVNLTWYRALAFALSGAIAGLFGSLDAFHIYSLAPEHYGFGFLVAVLSYVVLGGRRSVIGPIVGAVFLVSLPEIARPLAENRLAVYGILLILTVAYMPQGLADTTLQWLRKRRLAREAASVSAAGATP
jgi:branched-chain amino acid transport system permease protein